MKWTPSELRRKRKRERQSQWHRWFAWYPCHCNGGVPEDEQVVVWLQWAMRRRVWEPPSRSNSDGVHGVRDTRTVEYHTAQLLVGDKR